jgi:site-specific DNA-cytosine methylase
VSRKKKLVVVDFFSGHTDKDGRNGFSAAFTDRGHEVWTVELDPNLQRDSLFRPTAIVGDLFVIPRSVFPVHVDIVVASPPCEKFSVASMGRYWIETGVPRGTAAEFAIALVKRTKELIFEINPRAFLIENPTGMLRKLDVLSDLELRQITFCGYGERRRKPTDLWGGFPPNLKLNPPCKNGDPCHEPAPRGSRTGTQGIKGAHLRAKIPYGFSLAVCKAMESWK